MHLQFCESGLSIHKLLIFQKNEETKLAFIDYVNRLVFCVLRKDSITVLIDFEDVQLTDSIYNGSDVGYKNSGNHSMGQCNQLLQRMSNRFGTAC